MEGVALQSRSRLVVFTIAAALLVAPLTGCNTSKIRVRLPGFAKGNVDGLWFWRLESGAYRRICRFDFSNAYVSGGREVVDYAQSCLDGRPASAPWQATVERVAGDTNTVDIEITFRRTGKEKVAHRASAFSGAGESALSKAALKL
jgi:hypothetical protein